MPRRGAERPPQRAFDNATYVISGEQLAAEPRNYSDPVYGRSYGGDLPRPFDERNRPLGYCHPNADLCNGKPLWIARKQGSPLGGQVWSGVRRPAPAPGKHLNHQAQVGPHNAVRPGARAGTSANRGGSNNPSTSSATTSSETTSNGNYNSTGHSKPRYARNATTGGVSGTCRRPKHRTFLTRQSVCSPPYKSHERRVSWAPCALVVILTLTMALLLLLSLAAMVRSNVTMDAISSSGHPNVKSQKLQVVMSFFAPRAVTQASALPVRSSLASLVSGSPAKSLSVTTSSRNIEKRIERTTDKVSEVTLGKHTLMPHLRNGLNVRPRCGDVYYTVYRSSTKREFHYRCSVNVCVETAAGGMLSCNRGTNKFASLAHCRQSCNRVGSGAAKKCFGKPLLTSCTRQNVLFSWWFFEDQECVSWNFPSGGCPANDSALFRTAHECRSRSLSGRQRDSQCLPPRVVACDISRIKYAFFADRSMSDGRMRCLRSSPRRAAIPAVPD
ncbi:hypothetical protein MRX96_012841 [Rhipicephalus microplus]